MTEDIIVEGTLKTGNREYEIISFPKRKGIEVNVGFMTDYAKRMGIDLGDEDCQYILEHQAEIPSSLEGLYLIFTAKRYEKDIGRVAHLGFFRSFNWVMDYCDLHCDLLGKGRLLRRIK